ncbi:MAG: hypothetical protein IKW99_06335 [Bacteroidales bacterium]|nr:hypothetical protein [Bacteroidales bacterium]
MPKFLNLVYFVVAVFIIAFGIAALVNGSGKTRTNILILLIGFYFMYRGIALTVNAKRRAERESLESKDKNNDPANA